MEEQFLTLLLSFWSKYSALLFYSCDLTANNPFEIQPFWVWCWRWFSPVLIWKIKC